MRHEKLELLKTQVSNTNTIYQMVFDMNSIFGTKQFIDVEQQLYEQLKNITDEIDELVFDGIDKNNTTEITDALGDILTFAYGGLYMLQVTSYNEEEVNIISGLSTKEMRDGALVLREYIEKEVIEYNTSEKEAITNKFIDAAKFVLFWAKQCNMDIQKVMSAVTYSNYTKLMFDEKELKETFSFYNSKGVKDLYFKLFKTTDGIDYYVIFSGSDQVDNNNKAYRANKFLKSVYFDEPVV